MPYLLIYFLAELKHQLFYCIECCHCLRNSVLEEKAAEQESRSFELFKMSHVCKDRSWEVRAGDNEFKPGHSCVAHLKIFWATRVPVLNHTKNQTNKNSRYFHFYSFFILHQITKQNFVFCLSLK